MDWYASSLLQHCMYWHITSPSTSLSSWNTGGVVVGKCLRYFQAGEGQVFKDTNGYFQIIYRRYHAEFLYIYYASVCVQCVREGSKKVQKDWLIGKREILRGVREGDLSNLLKTWLYSKGCPLLVQCIMERHSLLLSLRSIHLLPLKKINKNIKMLRRAWFLLLL